MTKDHTRSSAASDADSIRLSQNWGLRKLQTADPTRPQWALQFMGMDWLCISEFLPPGNGGAPTINDDLRKFADELLRDQPQSSADIAPDDVHLEQALYEAECYGIGATSDVNQRVILQAAKELFRLNTQPQAVPEQQWPCPTCGFDLIHGTLTLIKPKESK